MPIFKPNDFLDKFELSREYKSFKIFYQKTLQEQWRDIVYSGLVSTTYDRFAPILSKKNNTKKSISKAEEDKLTTTEAVVIATSTAIAAKRKLQQHFTSKITKKMKFFPSYPNVPGYTNKYMVDLSNAAGQSELDAYLSTLGKKSPKFTLSKEYYRQQLRKRARTLWTGMDEYTANKFSSTLIRGMDKGDTKTQLVNRLLRTGKNMSEVRAKRIVQTETNASANFMRFETAKQNGSLTKIFRAVLDERTSHICSTLNGSVVSIDMEFETEVRNIVYTGNYPPMHVNCRSWVEYKYDSNYWLNAYILGGAIGELFIEKKKKGNIEFYETEKVKTIPNPNAVWSGGNKLVGKDSSVLKFYDDLRQYVFQEWKNFIKRSNFEELVDTNTYGNRMEEVTIKARRKLTDLGFIQLQYFLNGSKEAGMIKIKQRNNSNI